MLTALALVFGYIESLIPICPVPGIKLGISNIVILFALLRLGKPYAFVIMLLKVTISSILFSGTGAFLYALSGGILSIFAMLLSRKFSFSIIGTSMLGGIFHNIGQLLTASLILSPDAVLCYFPVLLLSGTVVGFLTGNIARLVLLHTEKAYR